MSDFSMEIMYLSQLFLTSPGFPLWLGMMITVAIFLGYFVFDDVKKLGGWLTAFVIYLVFQELLRYSYLSNLPIEDQITDPFRPVFLVVLSGLLFGSGLAIGGFISYRSKMRRVATRARVDKRIDEIKQNGHSECTNKENV